MTGLRFASDEATLRAKLAGQDPQTLTDRGVIVGTPASIPDALGTLSEAGVEAVYLQWLDLDDLDGLEGLASAVV
jgi:hypothetical protein